MATGWVAQEVTRLIGLQKLATIICLGLQKKAQWCQWRINHTSHLVFPSDGRSSAMLAIKVLGAERRVGKRKSPGAEQKKVQTSKRAPGIYAAPSRSAMCPTSVKKLRQLVDLVARKVHSYTFGIVFEGGD